MSAGESTPAPASLAALAAAEQHAKGLPGGPDAQAKARYDYMRGYEQGHADAWPTAYADGHEDGYKRGRADAAAASADRAALARAERERDEALEALGDITLSGISFDDERLKYIEVQIHRDDWMAALRIVAAAKRQPERIQSTKATRADLLTGISEDEQRVGREAVEAVRRKEGR